MLSLSLKTIRTPKLLLKPNIRRGSLKPVFKMNSAYLRYTPGSETFSFSFRYVDPELNIDRLFNLERKADEKVESFLRRIDVNLEKFLSKKAKKKQKKRLRSLGSDLVEDVQVHQELSENVKSGRIFFKKEDEVLGMDESCSCFFQDPPPKLNLNILEKVYEVRINAPWILSMKLPSSILAGFPVYPADFEHQFMDLNKSSFTWYKFGIGSKKWEEVGHEQVYHPKNEDIGCKLRLKCHPRNERLEGPEVSVDSSSCIEAGPGECPFERRHEFTREKLKGDEFRVTSYNILADTYADSDYSRKTLFPYCPAYALNIDYRKLLIIKELLGYNSDLICLQEVDKKVYHNDLKPALNSANLDGVFFAKGEISEGISVLYNTNRFELLDSEGIIMREKLDSYQNFSDIWKRIENENAKKRFIERNSVVLILTLKSIDNPKEVLVLGNTHLYFHPDADHIRLLQSFFALNACQAAADLVKQKHPDVNVSVLLCGDFNSTPPDGVYQLMTQKFVPEDHKDWKSNEEEVITNVNLVHNLTLSSACGTPKYTNFTVEFADCLDYIFYESDKLKVTKTVPMPGKDELELHSAIPSVVFPSDHIAICSDFKWTKL